MPTPGDITLTIHDSQPYADSRVVASGLGLDHGNLLESVDAHSERFTRFKPLNRSESRPNGGRPLRYLLMPRDAVTMLVAICRPTPQTLDWQAAVIEAFRRMEGQLSGNTGQLPADYPSALRALADEAEARQALAAKVESDAPKVAFAEAVEVAADTFTVRDVVKAIKPKPLEREFRAWLAANRWIFKRGDDWVPYSTRIIDKDMEISETTRKLADGSLYRDADGHTRVDRAAHFTGKGKVKVTAQWAKREGVA
jgi:phage antirepressor YoqD-like protein